MACLETTKLTKGLLSMLSETRQQNLVQGSSVAIVVDLNCMRDYVLLVDTRTATVSTNPNEKNNMSCLIEFLGIARLFILRIWFGHFTPRPDLRKAIIIKLSTRRHEDSDGDPICLTPGMVAIFLKKNPIEVAEEFRLMALGGLVHQPFWDYDGRFFGLTPKGMRLIPEKFLT